MINLTDLERKMQAIADWLSLTLKEICVRADYEIQDGGKFVLFSACGTKNPVYDKALRNLIYAEMTRCFQGVDAKWMLVFLDEKKDVIDEIDSIIGVDF
ncbi:hypothetical protein [Dyella choica]|uniref:Uncharacterized protein n=1 Tax=Dyella choica TaxID=1927959 RepID=A0A432M4N5_9GAMM|nr:hypothetical protein [Dyella choica]RUL74072.1 hypothetical protein EKH80_14685 [Dyella choica]